MPNNLQIKNSKIYITTPLFYPSSKPHLGHAYTTVIADVIKKYYLLIGVEAYLVTGLDEHGEKILEISKKKNISAIDLVNQNCEVFKNLWKKLKISFDSFVRTTSHEHKIFVQNVFEKFLKKKILYLDNWRGYYCVSCEENYSDIWFKENKNCKIGHELREKKEESFFFKCTEFKKWLSEEIKKNFVSPVFYKSEIKNSFLNDLVDLSVTRKKLDWGIKLLERDDLTIYVWFDALLGYLSADKNQMWNHPNTKKIQIIGKEILRFHAVYWPIILKNLDLKIFDKLICHGWLLLDNQKMSKSIGNVVDPEDLLNTFDVEIIRFFLISLNIKDDNKFSLEDIYTTNNTYLSNLFGNMISRFCGFVKKSNQKIEFDDKEYSNIEISQLNEKINNSLDKVINLIFNEEIQEVLEINFELLRNANKLIVNLSPWEIERTEKIFKEFISLIYKLIIFSNWLLSPILLDSSNKIFELLNVKKEDIDKEFFKNIVNFSNKEINSLEENFFPRFKFI